jgi:hypothetical protein
MLRRVALVRGATRRNVPEDGILRSHRRGNLKSFISTNCLHGLSLHAIVERYVGLPKSRNVRADSNVTHNKRILLIPFSYVFIFISSNIWERQ